MQCHLAESRANDAQGSHCGNGTENNKKCQKFGDMKENDGKRRNPLRNKVANGKIWIKKNSDVPVQECEPKTKKVGNKRLINRWRPKDHQSQYLISELE